MKLLRKLTALVLSLVLVLGTLTITAPAALAYPSNVSVSPPLNRLSTFFPDISAYQGTVDFEATRDAGVRGVMLRASHGMEKDKNYRKNAIAAKMAGLDYGVYTFATWHYTSDYSTARANARRQTLYLLQIIRHNPVTGYVVIDLEGSARNIGLSAAQITTIVNECFSLIRAAGYSPMLYCSVVFLYTFLKPNLIGVPLWLAYYYNNGSSLFPDTTYGRLMSRQALKIRFWQFTCTANGATYGASSKYIDLNYLYGSFT